MTNSYIFTGTGFVTGKYKITNDEIYSNVKKGFLEGFNDARIEASDSYKSMKEKYPDVNPFDYMVHHKMGFKDRYHVVPFPPVEHMYKNADNSLDLAVKAIDKALRIAGISGKQVDAWFVGTATPSQYAPGIAEFAKAYFTDVNDTNQTYSLTSACVGFNINLENAVAFFENHPEANHIVIAHAEVMSKLLLNEQDFVPFSTFGDSAAAVVLSRVQTQEKVGVINHYNGEDVAMLDFLGANNKGNLYMDARRVKSRAVPNIANSMQLLMEKCGWSKHDVDWFIPHQTGNAIVLSVRDLFDIDDNKLFQEVQYEYGNLSGASVPACIDVLQNTDRLKPGQKLISAVAGLGGEFGGFAYIVPDEIPKNTPQKELQGKRFLITGATGAIGNRIATFAAEQGADLILHYNSNTEFAENLKANITETYSVKVDLWKADLSDSENIKAFIDRVKNDNIELDYLINTHAITGGLSKASKVSDEEFVRVLSANYQSIKNLCDGLIDIVKEAVLITGSVGEDAQFPGSASYVSSKRALRGYAVNLASELYERRVNCIYYLPGLINDGMIAKLDSKQVLASIMSVGQAELVECDDIALRMLKSVCRLKIADIRMSYESKLKVIKDGYLKF